MRNLPESGIRHGSGTFKALLLGSILAVSITALACPADAALSPQKSHEAPARTPVHQVGLRKIIDNAGSLRRAVLIRQVAYNPRTLRFGAGSKVTKNGKSRVYAARYTEALQCVPFARAASGIELKGNAVNWWDAAAGVYERGNQPEAGAVLNFRANGAMRLGHVAVVRQVINSREIEIDHANWAWSGKGNISRGVAVIDVSERNDWSSVRVALGSGNDFGSIYSTYGFIYDRPDRGTAVASNGAGMAAPHRDWRGYDEVAEALSRAAAATYDAPVRSLR
jgi:surface antigen